MVTDGGATGTRELRLTPPGVGDGVDDLVQEELRDEIARVEQDWDLAQVANFERYDSAEFWMNADGGCDHKPFAPP